MNRLANTPLHVEFVFDHELGSHWQQVFVDFAISKQGQQTRVTGQIPDQAALFGLLKQIRDRNLFLVAFRVLN